MWFWRVTFSSNHLVGPLCTANCYYNKTFFFLWLFFFLLSLWMGRGRRGLIVKEIITGRENFTTMGPQLSNLCSTMHYYTLFLVSHCYTKIVQVTWLSTLMSQFFFIYFKVSKFDTSRRFQWFKVLNIHWSYIYTKKRLLRFWHRSAKMCCLISEEWNLSE